MVFFIRVAANVRGGNRNIRLRFSSHPTLCELACATESYFMTAVPQAQSSFQLDAMMLFDEFALRWVELYSAAQLSTDCQVYAFAKRGVGRPVQDRPPRPEMSRRNVRADREVIPPPGKTVACIASLKDGTSLFPFSLDATEDGVLTDIGESAADEEDACRCRRCAPITGPLDALGRHNARHGDRIRTVFDALDAQQKGYLLFTDLKRAVDAQRRVFINYSAKALMALADQDGDGRVSYKEWASFAVSHPAVVDAFFDVFAQLSRRRVPGGSCAHAPQASCSSLTTCRLSMEAYERSRAVLTHEEARLAADAVRLKALRDAWEKSGVGRRKRRGTTAESTRRSWRVHSVLLY
ncbi:hypothetical protein C3747_90g103 [Trypanosoma cruzi]|uniref:EF-hand domain-containing protein n=2 Tax=Trypanosoma cruzi TaxID=5693 RepID=Q4DPM5_TRYCC|nr:hypothetical protein, conserved [Trypanosoma cruzi]EAN94481.1 hypothetical protein, conserved [Trypanosoma cruzi]PWV08440.1 hypothetical protein C3747_90g103 [Trypanosoma cruzi]RNC61981.1 calmodulin-like protein containing EF hand domain [Trypanosoma cruzi]|eukprot:XP_816332.1 hypothetical protein [Trypanosoma cruzi strain CL Brener]